MEVRESLRPVVDYAIQIVVGAALFTFVLLVALALAGIVALLSMVGFAPNWLIDAAHWLELGIFGVDVFGFVLFLGSETAKLARALWRDWKRG